MKDFYKFDGAGNDFIMLDIRKEDPHLTEQVIKYLCHRRYGIGADGLMTLACNSGYDFEMRYYNSDGRLGSMCGNGGRCITAFANILGIKGAKEADHYHFLGYDGQHDSQLLSWDSYTGKGAVRLGMKSVIEIKPLLEGWLLDTGSPHYVLPVKDLAHYDVYNKGYAWRNRLDLFPNGVNVDFVEPQTDGTLFVRTFERGVEDETLSCGTGVTASALVYVKEILKSNCQHNEVNLIAPGGKFEVEFTLNDKGGQDIFLSGPVSYNFKGAYRFPKEI